MVEVEGRKLLRGATGGPDFAMPIFKAILGKDFSLT